MIDSYFHRVFAWSQTMIHHMFLRFWNQLNPTRTLARPISADGDTTAEHMLDR